VQTARALGIELFKIRTLSQDEWLIPGRNVPIYAQSISRGIGLVRVVKIIPSGSAPLPTHLISPFKRPPSEFLLPTNIWGHSLMAVIEGFTLKQLKAVMCGNVLDCEDGATVFAPRAQGVLTTPVDIPLKAGALHVSKVEMDIAIKVKQARLTVDQANAHRFMLALDDCVNNKTQLAFQGPDETFTEYSDRHEPSPSDHPLRNGIVWPYFKKQLFDYDSEIALHPDEDTLRGAFLAFPVNELPGMPEWFFSD
jgi:hypothetical protein